MGDKVFSPSRNGKIINNDGTGEARTLSFFEGVSRAVNELTSEMPAIANVELTSPNANEAALRDKINELLEALRTAKRLLPNV